MGAGDWDEETKVAAKEDLHRSVPRDRDRAYLIVLAGARVGEMYKIAADETVIGRGPQAAVQVVDDGISRRHAVIVRRAHDLVIRDLNSTNGTYCNGERVDEHILCDGDKIQVGSTTILKFTFHDSLEETFQREMYESALRDGLTRAFNKKYFLDRLESEFAYAARHHTALSLVMFDIDHFKRVNDSLGHLAGDYVLTSLAQVTLGAIRQEDVFARYGGEEFAIICRGIDALGALSFGERIRRSIEAEAFRFQGAPIQVTVSVGVAALPELRAQAALDLVAAADDALYQAKRQGRNRVVVATPP